MSKSLALSVLLMLPSTVFGSEVLLSRRTFLAGAGALGLTPRASCESLFQSIVPAKRLSQIAALALEEPKPGWASDNQFRITLSALFGRINPTNDNDLRNGGWYRFHSGPLPDWLQRIATAWIRDMAEIEAQLATKYSIPEGQRDIEIKKILYPHSHRDQWDFGSLRSIEDALANTYQGEFLQMIAKRHPEFGASLFNAWRTSFIFMQESHMMTLRLGAETTEHPNEELFETGTEQQATASASEGSSSLLRNPVGLLRSTDTEGAQQVECSPCSVQNPDCPEAKEGTCSQDSP